VLAVEVRHPKEVGRRTLGGLVSVQVQQTRPWTLQQQQLSQRWRMIRGHLESLLWQFAFLRLAPTNLQLATKEQQMGLLWASPLPPPPLLQPTPSPTGRQEVSYVDWRGVQHRAVEEQHRQVRLKRVQTALTTKERQLWSQRHLQ